MTTREQLTFERLEALCDYLASEGVIPAEWRSALAEIDSPERGREARQNAREGRGPPAWAGPPDDTGTSDTSE